jgi:hypothetical protein
MEQDDDDLLASPGRALARSAPGPASPYQNSDHHQIVPYRSKEGSVGHTTVLDDNESAFPMYHRAGESSSQNRAQTPMNSRTGRSDTQMQMQSPMEQPYERGPRILPPARSDTIKNTILFASRFTAAVLSNSWGSSPFNIAATIMDAIDVRRSLTTALLICTPNWFHPLFIQRVRLNEDLTNDLMSRFRAFFYLLGKMKDKAVPSPVLETFEE